MGYISFKDSPGIARTRFRVKGTKLYVKPMTAQMMQPIAAPSGYEGGTVNHPRTFGWQPSGLGPNSVLTAAIPLLRSRSRQLLRNEGLSSIIIDTLVTDVIGEGIKPLFKTPNTDFNKRLAELWLKWTDQADADLRLDYYGLQALQFRGMLEGGDTFTRLRTRRPEDGFIVPYQLQVLEAEFVPLEKNVDKLAGSGNTVKCGIELNVLGQRTAYWMYRNHPAESNMGTVSAETVPVPAFDVAHLCLVTRPGLLRGVPWLARALTKIHDLNQYDDAQVLRQKIAALFTGFVRAGDESEDIFPGQEPTDTGGVALASLEPGTMQYLGASQEVQFSEPPNPGDNYDVFVKHQERRIAAAGGVLYEHVSGDYSGVNDRTWRAAVSSYRRRCKGMQRDFIFQICLPIMQRFLSLASISNAIAFPTDTPPEKVVVKWLPNAWDYINPVQDIEAKNFKIRSGLSSRMQEVSEQGYDAEEIDAENEKDNTRADDLSLIYDSDPRYMTRQGAGITGSPGNVPAPTPPAPFAQLEPNFILSDSDVGRISAQIRSEVPPPPVTDPPQPIVLNVNVERAATKKTITTKRDANNNLVAEVVEEGVTKKIITTTRDANNNLVAEVIETEEEEGT